MAEETRGKIYRLLTALVVILAAWGVAVQGPVEAYVTVIAEAFGLVGLVLASFNTRAKKPKSPVALKDK